MLRVFQETENKPKNTMYSAGTDMITGMGVVKDHSTLKVDFPDAETGVNVSFVTKERVPTGINTARGDMSDYDEDFTKVATSEMVGLKEFYAGERFGVDTYDTAATYTAGDKLAVDATGKIVKASAGTLTALEFVEIYDDAGHDLIKIEVLGTAVEA